MTSGPLPVETFRLQAFRRGPGHFLIHVADSLQEMRLAMRVFGVKPHRLQLGACIQVEGQGPLKHLLGVVFMSRTHFGAGLVAHELAHAAFRAVERRGLKVRHWAHADRPSWQRSRGGHLRVKSRHPEEQFCDILERLTRDFWTEAYTRGLA